MQIIKRKFTNGYGVSVVDHGYGSESGLFELAVTYDGKLCYDTPITNDVLGWLTLTKVDKLMVRVAALPKKGTDDGE